MKKNNPTSNNHIPDLDIIDLELVGDTEETPEVNNANEQIEKPINETEQTEAQEIIEVDEAEVDDGTAEKPKKGIRSFLNIHVLLLCVFVVFVLCIVGKFQNWGVYIDIKDITSDHSIGYLDVLDQMIPVRDEAGNVITSENVENIVVFGNYPFSDDWDSDDNLANMIAEATGANVYNCSVSGSYMGCMSNVFTPEKAWDAYSFYWLVTLGLYGTNSHYYPDAEAALGENLPAEAPEVYDTLTGLDFSTVDVVVVMYDATDYLMGRKMYDDANSTNIQTFTGNMEAGLELLKREYPEIRIIVMSPPYAYARDLETNEYVSSDMYRYGEDVLSTYVIKQSDSCFVRGVTFVDNLYGTITEDNADEYLTDNLHLNQKGREAILERFLYALNYYNEE